MTDSNLSDDELVALFTESDHITAKDVPAPIMAVLRYIKEHTGLTGEYNDGLVTLADEGDTIQVYPRSRSLSSHDNLLQWVQLERDDVIFGTVTTRNHPKKDNETNAYVEIHEASRWEPIV